MAGEEHDGGLSAPNLRHLRILLATAKHGSITAAAEAVRLSQPAISQAIKKLEGRYGQLLRRSPSGVALTKAGSVLAARLETAFRHLEQGLKDLARRDSDAAIMTLTAAQLNALSAVVRHGSFAAASRKTGLAPPTLHRAVRGLEANVDAALLERTTYGVRPTRRAEEFCRRAQLFFREIVLAESEIAALSGQATGSTAIGAMALARSFLVPSAVSSFMRENPRHVVSIVEGPYEVLLSSLRRGETDVLVGALRGGEPTPDVVQERLFDDELSIVMRVGHPLAASARPGRAALSRYPWVAPRKDTPLRAHFEALFDSVSLPVDLVECNSVSAARVLVAESDRLMLSSNLQYRYERAFGMLTTRPHPGGKVRRVIGLTYRADWSPTSEQKRLLEMLRDLARKISV